jgi:hypothetical protein
MEKLQSNMKTWGESLLEFHLPRWEELPTLELYMDQVITLIDQYLSPVIQTEKHPLLTSSMVNNYVKKGMIPAPEKKTLQPKASRIFDRDHDAEASVDNSRNKDRHPFSRESCRNQKCL